MNKGSYVVVIVFLYCGTVTSTSVKCPSELFMVRHQSQQRAATAEVGGSSRSHDYSDDHNEEVLLLYPNDNDVL